VIDARPLDQRVADLEHDNNLLRARDADRQVEYQRLSREFEQLGQKCERLIAKVNEFVDRFAVVQ
jgi:hypothetical protein